MTQSSTMEEKIFLNENAKKKKSESGSELSDKWKLVNVILLGFAFMLLFTAFLTTSMIGKYVTDSLKTEILEDLDSNENFVEFNQTNWDAYNSFEEYSEAEKCELMEKKYVDTLLGDGYISLSIVYVSFALMNFVAPGIVGILGHKTTMFIAALTYLLYILVFMNPTPLFLYAVSGTIS